MKRFGWSRPALLIGFVLADQVETYLYQAIQFYEWGFLTRPGVIALAIIIVVSVLAGVRNKPQARSSENAPDIFAGDGLYYPRPSLQLNCAVRADLYQYASVDFSCCSYLAVRNESSL